ncbi:Aste57867_24952 [Aphanomyces stellatus]|uniref:Aste57867_24952 protein n=1 Tax=Aphanomyces stellatus TaxID=120398 RepID=A0A485LRV8_9STRA|nr:hypothetical protein As57867_024874 [Aphanomyces stellatus]VFU01583.1 Aste57867_24952 [Aphanomyces stellatus]
MQEALKSHLPLPPPSTHVKALPGVTSASVPPTVECKPTKGLVATTNVSTMIVARPPMSPKVSFDVEKDPTDAALANASNFCFLNATLHCLFRSPQFLTSLHRSMYARDRRLSTDTKETCCWYLMETGFAMKEDKDGCVDVVRLGLASAMKACSTLINVPRQDQQDAEECLTFFLDILNEVTKAPVSIVVDDGDTRDLMQEIRASSSIHPESYSHLVTQLADASWAEHSARNPSFITQQFVGQIVRGSSCHRCQRLSCHLQEMSVLSLGLHTATSAMSLESCLDHFKDIEEMTNDNQVWCSPCQDKTNQRIQTLLLRLPPCLVVQLKRFTWASGSGKNGAPVYFPVHRLNMAPYLFERTRDAFYHLYAVCAHLGSSLGAGHYVAYCRLRATHTTSIWLKYDDEHVTIVDEPTMLEETLCSAYLLFYERIP